jgi:hypothetical protein
MLLEEQQMHAQNQTTPPQPSPAAKKALVLRECAICQSSIYPTEATTTCPACALVYHAECWQMNQGCASYGCEQVNALAPKKEEEQFAPLPPPSDLPPEPLPWSFLLLGASALALVASSLTYGLPSAFVTLLVALRMWRRQGHRDRTLVAAGVVCLAGIVAGVLISRFWFARGYTHDLANPSPTAR